MGWYLFVSPYYRPFFRLNDDDVQDVYSNAEFPEEVEG